MTAIVDVTGRTSSDLPRTCYRFDLDSARDSVTYEEIGSCPAG